MLDKAKWEPIYHLKQLRELSPKTHLSEKGSEVRKWLSCFTSEITHGIIVHPAIFLQVVERYVSQVPSPSHEPKTRSLWTLQLTK